MTNPKDSGQALERFRPTMPPDVIASWAADAQAELDALRADQARLTLEHGRMRDRLDRAINAAEKHFGEDAIRYKLSLFKNGRARNYFPANLDGHWVALQRADNDAHIGLSLRLVEAQAELDALRQAAYEALKCRDAYGWSPEADEALERLRESLSPAGAPMTAQAEVYELRRWKSTNAPRLDALQGLLRHAQQEAHEGREAVASLASERAANALLTNELDALRAELARKSDEVQRLWKERDELRDEAEALRQVLQPTEAELDALRKSAPGWLPIESAPKDGTIILIGCKPCRRLEGSRRVYEGRWNVKSDEWTSVNGFLIFASATDWMPLPAAPDDSTGG